MLTPLAEITDYESLVKNLRERMDAIGITHDNLNELAGFADRYSQKILTLTQPRPSSSRPRDGRGSVRRIGMQSLGPLLGALSVKLVLVEDPEALERNRSRYEARDEAHTTSAKARWCNDSSATQEPDTGPAAA